MPSCRKAAIADEQGRCQPVPQGQIQDGNSLGLLLDLLELILCARHPFIFKNEMMTADQRPLAVERSGYAVGYHIFHSGMFFLVI